MINAVEKDRRLGTPVAACLRKIKIIKDKPWSIIKFLFQL